jgi:CBS domain-containing protein
MTRKVFSVKRAAPVMEVAELMAEKAVSGVPVIEEDGKVAGIISEKDFLRHMGAGDKLHFMAVVAECLSRKGCVAMPIRSQTAEEIMTSPAITVRENATVVQISNTFNKKKINRVPVVDSEGRLAGLVSRDDIMRAYLMKTRSKT